MWEWGHVGIEGRGAWKWRSIGVGRVVMAQSRDRQSSGFSTIRTCTGIKSSQTRIGQRWRGHALLNRCDIPCCRTTKRRVSRGPAELPTTASRMPSMRRVLRNREPCSNGPERRVHNTYTLELRMRMAVGILDGGRNGQCRGRSRAWIGAIKSGRYISVAQVP